MKRINILRVPSYKSLLTHQHGGPHQQRYIYPAFLHSEKWDLQAIYGCTSPFQGPKADFRRVNFYHFQDGKIIDMFISKGRKKSGLTFKGQLVAGVSGCDGALPAYRWAAIWQRQNGRCRTNQGDHLATYDEDFRIRAAGFAAAQSETGTCLWRQHACSGSNLTC